MSDTLKNYAQVNADWKAQQLDVVVATVAFGMGLDRPSECMHGCVCICMCE